MNKLTRKVAIIMVFTMMCVLLCSCSQQIDPINTADNITVTNLDAGDWICSYSDEDTVNSVLEMYNSIMCTESEEKINLIDDKDVYRIKFYSGSEFKGEFIVDGNNNFTYSSGSQVYHITSGSEYKDFADILQPKINKTLKSIPSATESQADKDSSNDKSESE